MSTYFNDCSSLTGWTDQDIGSGTQFSVSGSTITSASSAAEILSLDAVDSDADRESCEILLKYKTSAWNSTHYIGIARGSDSGSATTLAGYIVALRSTAIRTYYKNSGGSITQIATATLSALSTDTYYWVRLRCNGTSIKAKVWADGGSEPGTWDCDATDTSGPGAVDGYAGIYSPNASTHTWDSFGVGTNGDTAPSSAGGGGATGTLAATESGSDTAALTGDVLIDGALAATESGSDTAALTGDVIVQGALAVTESGTDTAAATGLVLVQGALAATESGSDTAALAGLVLVQGSIASVEPGADTASIAGDVLVSGALAASETGSDTAAFTGDASLGIFGSIDAAESGSDSAQVTGLVLIQGGLAVTETGSDTAAITGPAAVSGSIAATETGSDTAAVTGLVLIYGSLATTETGSDTAAVSSFRPTVPGIEYTLPEGKAHYTLPDGRAHYTIAA